MARRRPIDRRPSPVRLADTLDAIDRLELQLTDCDGPVARGIVQRAVAHLEASLLQHLTGHPAR